MYNGLPGPRTYRVFQLDLVGYPRQEYPIQVTF